MQARLGELGYRTHGCVVEVDTYYSRPEVDYLASVECLRVRRWDGFAEITSNLLLTAQREYPNPAGHYQRGEVASLTVASVRGLHHYVGRRGHDGRVPG